MAVNGAVLFQPGLLMRVIIMNTSLCRSTSVTAPLSLLLAGSIEFRSESFPVNLPVHAVAASPVSAGKLDCQLHDDTLVIRLGKILDIIDHRSFRHAYEDAAAEVRTYVVDFGKTRWIDSSVLGMLLLLRKHAGGSRERIHLMDVGAEVRNIMGPVNLNALFTMDMSVSY